MGTHWMNTKGDNGDGWEEVEGFCESVRTVLASVVSGRCDRQQGEAVWP